MNRRHFLAQLPAAAALRAADVGGRELEHSPDGYAYLAGHGTYDSDGSVNWSSGDAVSLARVRPAPETINDPTAWEFFAGHSNTGEPRWSHNFAEIAPVLTWPGGAGCVNITYHPHMKRYFGFLCVGWADGDSGPYDMWVVLLRLHAQHVSPAELPQAHAVLLCEPAP